MIEADMITRIQSDRTPPISHAATQLSRAATRHTARQGLTLVELLITISILAILASLIIGATAAATNAARAARTKSLINKIHALVMERYSSYKTRRVDVSIVRASMPNASSAVQTRLQGEVMADARLAALRELMRLEMPDRWSDVIGNSVGGSYQPPRILSYLPPLTIAYRRHYERMQSSNPTPETILDNQGAECLYLTVMLATGEGEARTHFGDQDIGDVDGDGAPEFLDGWGNPIHFIRWPAGFAFESSLLSGDSQTDPDSFDLYRRDRLGVNSPPLSAYLRRVVAEMRAQHANGVPRGYRLLPLIYSGGSDGDPDINTAKLALVTDPYLVYNSDSVSSQLGYPMDGTIGDPDDGRNWVDNIHNHLLDNQ